MARPVAGDSWMPAREVAGGDVKIRTIGHRAEERQAVGTAGPKSGPTAFDGRPRQRRNKLGGESQQADNGGRRGSSIEAYVLFRRPDKDQAVAARHEIRFPLSRIGRDRTSSVWSKAI